MNFLLRLKHWQLFMLTWGIPLTINIVGATNMKIIMFSFPFTMTLFAIGTFGWIWAISVTFNSLLPENTKLNLKFFKGMFLVPAVYISLILIALILTFFGVKIDGLSLHPAVAFAFVLIHLFSMVVIFLSIRFAAKTLKSIELQRSVKFGDYAGEFFLIWFSLIGYWVLQPRINKLLEQTEG
jgi:hypothetical protein